MGHFGEDDKNPSPADMRKLDTEMTRHGKVHEFHSYANAAHAFANFGSAAYREHAATASWPRTFGFFAKHLKKDLRWPRSIRSKSSNRSASQLELTTGRVCR
jgi:carboxymethylenebutenolidase